MPKEFYITGDQSGRRTDRLLRNMWPQVPLGALKKAIRTGEVRLMQKVRPDTRVGEGQFLQVPWNNDRPAKETIKRIHRPSYMRDWKQFTKMTTDNKQARRAPHPAGYKNGDSLITRVREELNGTRNDFRPSTVQRLDRNTSGAVMTALTGPSLRYLSELDKERKIKKTYRAAVAGEIKDSGEIDLPLLKDQPAIL